MDEIKSKEWWQDVSYANAKVILQASIREMTDSFVTAGYYLKLIRDTEGYKEDGYGTIWEFAEAEYGLQRTTASRWMAINDRFSKDGNAPELADQYKNFGKSQLQEMLYLTDDQTAEVTPDMTVKQIREIRRPEPQSEPKVKPLSALGYPRREYPPGSLIATAGCGSNDCFSCHLAGCEIRGEECYCVEASCGNPFPCTVLEQTETLKQEIGYSCQFVNPDLAKIRADGMSIPCCRNCETPCAHECGRSGAKRSKGTEADSGADIREDCATSHTVTEQPAEISQDVKDEPRFTSAFVRDILWNKERELRDLEECNTDPAGKLPLQLLQSRRAVVAGLRLLLEYTEMREERENEQTDTKG